MRIAPRLAIVAFAALSVTFSAAQAQQPVIAPGDAAVTGFSGVPLQPSSERIDRNGPSLRVIGLPAVGPYGLVNAPKRFTATARDIGQVFGVALDNQPTPDIFVAATSAYGLALYRPGRGRMRFGAPGAQYTPNQFGPIDQGGGPDSIWRIDGATGQVSLFANIAFNGIQNTPASLGALAFDANTQQLFVSDRATGLIHRLGMDGTDRGVFDHGLQGRQAAHLQPVPFDPSTLANIQSKYFDTQDSRSWGFAPAARRVFALAMHNGRLYYSVAAEFQIWSVGIAGNGAFIGDARFEAAAPALQPGIEISQIAFDYRGQMFVAERGAPTGSPDFVAAANGGQNRVLRFQPKEPGDPSPGYWHMPADEYAIGMLPAFQNADGGVGLSCGRNVWSTGERMLDPGNAPPGSFPTIDGLQGNDSTLVKPANMPPQQAVTVNYYDHQADPDSRGHMGSIAIWNVCSGGGEPPPPPPPAFGGSVGFACPPGTFAMEGTCLVAPMCPVETEWHNGYCVYPHCPDGFVNIRGECRPPPFRCRPGEVFFNDRCMPVGCPPGLDRADNGYCRCPRDLVYRDGECVPPCPSDEMRNSDGRCVTPCPNGDQRDRATNGQCGSPCQTGDQRDRSNNGQCGSPCPTGDQRDRSTNGQCGSPCPTGDQRDRSNNGQCGSPCPTGDQRDRSSNGQCGSPCPTGDQRDRSTNGQCGSPCPTGDQRDRSNNGQCGSPCPTGDQRDRSSNGQCGSPCPTGEKRNSDGQCYKPTTTTHHCPQGEVRRDGRCVSAGGGSSNGSGGLGCSRAQYDRLGHCPTSTTTTTKTTTTTTRTRGSAPHHYCAKGEVRRDGRCVSSGGSRGSSSGSNNVRGGKLDQTGGDQTIGGKGSDTVGQHDGGKSFGGDNGTTGQTYRGGRGPGADNGGRSYGGRTYGGKTYGGQRGRGNTEGNDHRRDERGRGDYPGNGR